MDKVTVKNIVNHFREQLIVNGLRIHKVILFGSSVEGELSDKSDIDIAVISDDFKDVDIFDRALLTIEAERETMKKFDYPLDVIRLTINEFEKDLRMISLFVKNGKHLSV